MDKVKSTPRFPELLMTEDGRVYDSIRDKWINIIHNHNHSFNGPAAYYHQNGKTVTLNILRLLYETYISHEVLKSDCAISLVKGDEIHYTNLKKSNRWKKENPVKQEKGEQHSCWMGGDSIYI